MNPHINSSHTGIMDAYNILQVTWPLSMDQVKRQYKMLALRYHPDKKPHGDAEKFKQITIAYQYIVDNTPPNIPTTVDDILNDLILQIMAKYNINGCKNYHLLDFDNIKTILQSFNTDTIFMKLQTLFNPDLVNPYMFTKHHSAPNEFACDTHVPTLPTEQIHIVSVTLQDIYDDSIMTVIIKTNNDCKHYKVPALYETITFEEPSLSPSTVTIQVELENNTIFDIYNESHLCIVHDVSIIEYFTHIKFNFKHLNGNDIDIDIHDPHCTCQHYIDGIFCKYTNLGLPLEHNDNQRGDLFVFFNVRKDLENYI